ELGIDQGPIVIMIENYRTQKVWNLFMKNEEAQRGLQRAGFVSLAWMMPLQPQADPGSNTFMLTWNAIAGRTYQVEYSPDLFAWFGSPSGQVTASSASASWTDSLAATQRFYRVFQFGLP